MNQSNYIIRLELSRYPQRKTKNKNYSKINSKNFSFTQHCCAFVVEFLCSLNNADGRKKNHVQQTKITKQLNTCFKIMSGFSVNRSSFFSYARETGQHETNHSSLLRWEQQRRINIYHWREQKTKPKKKRFFCISFFLI